MCVYVRTWKSSQSSSTSLNTCTHIPFIVTCPADYVLLLGMLQPSQRLRTVLTFPQTDIMMTQHHSQKTESFLKKCNQAIISTVSYVLLLLHGQYLAGSCETTVSEFLQIQTAGVLNTSRSKYFIMSMQHFFKPNMSIKQCCPCHQGNVFLQWYNKILMQRICPVALYQFQFFQFTDIIRKNVRTAYFILP